MINLFKMSQFREGSDPPSIFNPPLILDIDRVSLILAVPYQHKITLYLPRPSLHPPYTRYRLLYGLYKHLINLREI